MGERADQIEKEIQQERGELDKNLHELEQRVRDMTDWRVQFNHHPLLMMGVAVGVGAALSTIGGKRNRKAAAFHRLEEVLRPNGLSPVREPSPLKVTWDTLKAALITVGTGRLCHYIEEQIPGFSSVRRSAA